MGAGQAHLDAVRERRHTEAPPEPSRGAPSQESPRATFGKVKFVAPFASV